MFYEFGGKIINLDRVRCIERMKDKKHVLITYEDERREQVWAPDQDIRYLIAPIIPASPGFGVVMVSFRKEAPTRADVRIEPVVAWRMTKWGPDAITLDERGSDGTEAILKPDGSVVHPAVARWSSIEEWLVENVRFEWEQWRDRQQSQEANP